MLQTILCGSCVPVMPITQPLLCYFMSVKMGTIFLKLKTGIMEWSFKMWNPGLHCLILNFGSSNYQSCGLRPVTCKVKPEGKMEETSGAGMVGPWRGCTGCLEPGPVSDMQSELSRCLLNK